MLSGAELVLGSTLAGATEAGAWLAGAWEAGGWLAVVPPHAATRMAAPARRAASRLVLFFILVSISSKKPTD